MVHRSVLQWTRRERVPLSLYERTFFSVLHFHFMSAFQTRPKRRRGFPFPNNHRRPSKVLTTLLLTLFTIVSIRPSIFFSYSYNAFPHFFSTFTIWPCIPSLLHCPTGHECRRFPCQNRINKISQKGNSIYLLFTCIFHSYPNTQFSRRSKYRNEASFQANQMFVCAHTHTSRIHTSSIFSSPFMRHNLIIWQQSSSAIQLFKLSTLIQT